MVFMLRLLQQAPGFDSLQGGCLELLLGQNGYCGTLVGINSSILKRGVFAVSAFISNVCYVRVFGSKEF